MPRWPTKRERADETLLIIMVTAVTSVLVARAFVNVTNNWQLGRGNWHLAHVLWGGLAMFVGGLVPMLFHGSKTRTISGLFFGVGVGLFVDEIGKFITKDNNYFFQPAILFIYGFFVALFLFYRYLGRFNQKDPRSLLYQILGQMEEIAEGDLEINEKKKLLKKIKQVGRRSSGELQNFSLKLGMLVKGLPASVDKKELKLMIWIKNLKRFSYYRIFKKKVVLYALLLLAVGDIITSLVTVQQVLWWRHSGGSLAMFVETEVLYPRFDSYMVGGKIISDAVASLLFLVGIVWVSRRRFRRGLLFFQNGLLVNIFFAAIFNFYFEQFSAVIGLGINIALLLGITRLRRDFVV